jgi:hypothetical protein
MNDSLRTLAGDAAQPDQSSPTIGDPQALPTARRGTM